MTAMTGPFHGGTARRRGQITDHRLRHEHTMILPGIYVPTGVELTAFDRARAVWLWTKGRTVLTGYSAAALWGVRWIDGHAPASCAVDRRVAAPSWVHAHRTMLGPQDCAVRHGMAVTTPVRTAYDLGRWLDEEEATVMIDALLQTGRLSRADLADFVRAHPARRGVRRLRRVVDQCDAGAESPWETRTRLAIVQAGLPAPQTQLTICDAHGNFIGRADMGWRRWRTAVDYEGAGHCHADQLTRDVRRGNRLAGAGWRWIRVRAADLTARRRPEFLAHVRAALRAGGAPV